MASILSRIVKHKVFSEILSLILSLALGLGITIFLIKKIGLNNIIQTLASFSASGFISVLLLSISSLIIGTIRWGFILKTLGHKIDFSKLFIFRIVGWTVSYITPSILMGGEPVRAYMIKKERQVPFSLGLSSVVIDKILGATAGFVLVVFGLLLIFVKSLFYVSIGLALIVILTLAFLALFLFYFKNFKKEGIVTFFFRLFRLNKIKFTSNWEGKIIDFDRQLVTFFKSHKKAFVLGLVLSFINLFIILLRYKVLIHFLGLEISFLNTLIIYALFTLIVIVPFFPGSLGIYEAVHALSFSLLGLTAQGGISYSFILRCQDLILIGLGLVFLSYFGLLSIRKLYWLWQTNTNNKNKQNGQNQEKNSHL